jgi:hypothetical protein
MKDLVVDVWNDGWLGRLLFLIFTLVVAAIPLAIWSRSEEQKQWNAFALQHKCKAVAHISGDVFNTVGVGANGQVAIGIGSTPDKTGYLCDDGQTYYR